jgi:hypothetical protein
MTHDGAADTVKKKIQDKGDISYQNTYGYFIFASKKIIKWGGVSTSCHDQFRPSLKRSYQMA